MKVDREVDGRTRGSNKLAGVHNFQYSKLGPSLKSNITICLLNDLINPGHLLFCTLENIC